jgi:hypothetical protein
MLLASSITWGDWSLTGNFTTIDLIVVSPTAFAVAYVVCVLALFRGWEEPLVKEPAGVYQHSDGRPLVGRKLKGKSRRELRDLGLLVEEPDATRTDRSRGE